MTAVLDAAPPSGSVPRPASTFDAALSCWTAASGASVQWVTGQPHAGFFRLVPADPDVPATSLSAAEMPVALHLSGARLSGDTDVAVLIELIADTVARVGPSRVAGLDARVRRLNGRAVQPGPDGAQARRELARLWSPRRAQLCVNLAFRVQCAACPLPKVTRR